jgi:hypothetical protein
VKLSTNAFSIGLPGRIRAERDAARSNWTTHRQKSSNEKTGRVFLAR